MLGSLLVDISLAVVGLLVNLVANGITSSLEASADRGVGVLGN
jgi:hypothetical protein